MEPNKNKSNSLDMLSKLAEIKHEYEINKKLKEEFVDEWLRHKNKVNKVY